jgi:2-polyprenyl-3-methyl-5-hydroxy-6-metoxy-1,4-benzoquinol methylase
VGKLNTAIDAREMRGNVHVDLDHQRPLARHHYLAELAARHGGNGHYLDVGCGPGLLLKLIQDRQPDATFSIVDAYPVCLDLAEARLGSVASRYVLDEQKFEPDKIITGQFDTIVLSHVLEHLRDPIGGINALMTLLKPGGVLILAVPNLGRLEVCMMNLFGRHYVNRGHVFGWDRSHWRNFLERICGLDVIEYGADVVTLLPGFPGRAIGRIAGRRLAKILPGWSVSNVAVVRKPLLLENQTYRA